ncbi:MAG: hypothetical protein E7317_02665 [Clostridiales bacterium]|nr:hypothetical protein [Clostridiales bacterium]
MFTMGTEMTTAATDLVNAAASLVPILWLMRRRPVTKHHRLWTAAFVMFALVSLAGVGMHGFVLGQAAHDALWCAMYLLLTLMLTLYAACIRHDIRGDEGFGRFFRVTMALAVVVAAALGYVNIVLPPYSFPLFSLYCVVNLVYMIALLAPRARADGRYRWYLAAIGFFVAGSLLQAVKGIRFTIVWEFNSNAVYHFALLIFLFVQFKGVRLVEPDWR